MLGSMPAWEPLSPTGPASLRPVFSVLCLCDTTLTSQWEPCGSGANCTVCVHAKRSREERVSRRQKPLLVVGITFCRYMCLVYVFSLRCRDSVQVLPVTLSPLVDRRRNNLKLWRRPFCFRHTLASQTKQDNI